MKKIFAKTILTLLLTIGFIRVNAQTNSLDSASLVNSLFNGTKLRVIDSTTYSTEEEKTLSSITLQLKAYDDSVVLRWAPSDRQLWHKANHKGYILERRQFVETDEGSEDDNFISKFLSSAENPIKPYDSAQWSPFFPNNDQFSLIAAGAVAGQLEIDQQEMGFGLKSQQDQSIFGLVLLSADLSTLAANGLGLRFVDKDVEKGQIYEYRISVADSTYLAMADSLHSISPKDLLLQGDTTGFYKLIDWKYRSVEMLNYSDRYIATPELIDGFEALSGDKSVSLRWDAGNGLNEFSGFVLEKSSDGGRSFDSLTTNVFISEPIWVSDSTKEDETPKLVYQYIDHFETNYVEYTYRITGIDAFADRSLPAVTKGMGKNLKRPVNPVIKSGKYLKERGLIELIYEVPEVPDDFHDLYFEYANHGDSSFVRYESETLNPTDTVYYHSTQINEYSHYFRLALEDTTGIISRSYPVFVNIPDSIPPPVPTGLKAVINTAGQVDITWDDLPLSEQEFLGYRVYYANNPKRQFSQLTTSPIVSNFYIYHIPLNTLSEKIYFKVQAVDKHYNHSEFSEVYQASKPDTIPPVVPVFKPVKVNEKEVELSWGLSPSRDVIKQILFRKSNNQDERSFIIDNNKQNSFKDSTASKGVVYEYRLQAVDDSGLKSELSFPVKAKLVDKKRLDMVNNLKAHFDQESRLVSLNWNYNSTENDLKFLIYRNFNDEKLRKHDAINGDKKVFQELVSKPGVYHYSVRVIDKKGHRSLISDQVSVKVK